MKRLYTRLLFIFTVLAAFLVTDCWKAEPHKTPWEVEEQAYLSYEEYFSQQRLYDYAEDVFLAGHYRMLILATTVQCFA